MGKGLMMTFVLSILHIAYSFYGVTDYFDLSLNYCEICEIPRINFSHIVPSEYIHGRTIRK